MCLHGLYLNPVSDAVDAAGYSDSTQTCCKCCCASGQTTNFQTRQKRRKTHRVPAVLHEGDQLGGRGLAMRKGQAGPLWGLPVLVCYRMQHFLHQQAQPPSDKVAHEKQTALPREELFHTGSLGGTAAPSYCHQEADLAASDSAGPDGAGLQLHGYDRAAATAGHSQPEASARITQTRLTRRRVQMCLCLITQIFLEQGCSTSSAPGCGGRNLQETKYGSSRVFARVRAQVMVTCLHFHAARIVATNCVMI